MKARIRENIVHEACFSACDALTAFKNGVADMSKNEAPWIEKPGIAVGAMADAVDAFVADWLRLMRENRGGQINERALRAAYNAYAGVAKIEWSLFGMHQAILAYLATCQEGEDAE